MKPLTAAQRKQCAIASFDAALANPSAHDWQALAIMLRSCVTMPKTKASEPTPDAEFAPWHDDGRPHKLRKGNSKRTIRVEFVDGRSTVASASDYGRFNVGRAVRVACTMYRHQVRRAGFAYGPLSEEHWHKSLQTFGGNSEWWCRLPWAHDCYVEHIAVAEIASIVCETTGDVWDPAVANAESAAYRAAGESLGDREARIAAGREAYAAAVKESKRLRVERILRLRAERKAARRAAKPQGRPLTPFARRLLSSTTLAGFRPLAPSLSVRNHVRI